MTDLDAKTLPVRSCWSRAAHGIGAVTLAFARQGATVCLSQRPCGAQQLCDEGNQAGLRITARPTSACADRPPRSCSRPSLAAGRLDVLVNNAGIFLARPVLEMSDAGGTRSPTFPRSSIAAAPRCRHDRPGRRRPSSTSPRLQASAAPPTTTPTTPRPRRRAGLHPLPGARSSTAASASTVCPGRIATDLPARRRRRRRARTRCSADTPIRRLGTPDRLALARALLGQPQRRLRIVNWRNPGRRRRPDGLMGGGFRPNLPRG